MRIIDRSGTYREQDGGSTRVEYGVQYATTGAVWISADLAAAREAADDFATACRRAGNTPTAIVVEVITTTHVREVQS